MPIQKKSRQKVSDDDLPLREDALAGDMHGNNSLRGNDQSSVRNQRLAVPDVQQETTSVRESFRRIDPDERAKAARRRK